MSREAVIQKSAANDRSRCKAVLSPRASKDRIGPKGDFPLSTKRTFDVYVSLLFERCSTAKPIRLASWKESAYRPATIKAQSILLKPSLIAVLKTSSALAPAACIAMYFAGALLDASFISRLSSHGSPAMSAPGRKQSASMPGCSLVQGGSVPNFNANVSRTRTAF